MMLCGFTWETIAIKHVIDFEMPFSHGYGVATGSLVVPALLPSGRVLQDYTLLASQSEQVAGIKVLGDSMESLGRWRLGAGRTGLSQYWAGGCISADRGRRTPYQERAAPGRRRSVFDLR